MKTSIYTTTKASPKSEEALGIILGITTLKGITSHLGTKLLMKCITLTRSKEGSRARAHGGPPCFLLPEELKSNIVPDISRKKSSRR